jgi:uncharacterized protein with FMN-binding domain
MKKVLKWTGIVLAVLIVAMVIYSLFGMQKALTLRIGTVDMGQVADGTYTGSYDSYRWSTTVEVTVKDHAVTGIRAVKAQPGRDSLNATLTEKIIKQQRVNVDAVSGATASSKSFLMAVQTALSNGVLQSAAAD